MAHGRPAGFETLYDKDGKPVDVVKLVDGSRVLMVTDDPVNRTLGDIKDLLEEILEELKEG